MLSLLTRAKLTALLLAATSAHADTFAHIGQIDGVSRFTLGVVLPTNITVLGLSLRPEFSMSHWSKSGNSWEASAVPMLRYGTIAYIEAGIGIAYFSNRDFAGLSTSWQFADHIGVGYGPIGLRFSHFSNGGVRQPNSGVNVLQLTYRSRF